MNLKDFLEAPDYRVPDATCINCKKLMDGATPTDGGRAPLPNDVAICAYCGHLQAYGDDLKFRELTDIEILECAGDPKILMAQEFGKRFREHKEKLGRKS
jgi:hypothetical protein